MVTTSGVGAALGGSARHRSVFISASAASIASSRAAAAGCWCSQCSEPCRPIVSGQGERATEERRKLSQFVGRLGCHRQRRKLDVGETGRWPRHWPSPNVRRGDGLASPCPRHRRSFAELRALRDRRARRARRVKLRCGGFTRSLTAHVHTPPTPTLFTHRTGTHPLAPCRPRNPHRYYRLELPCIGSAVVVRQCITPASFPRA